MDHYIPVYYRWFKRLKYITVSDQDEERIIDEESLVLRDLRTFLSAPKSKSKRNTMKSLFIDSFIYAVNNDYPILNDLNSMKL
jgi:hypothetical protein